VATFNAGAIEATLTLDRSPWNRDLRAAQAQARRFSATKISPKLNIDGMERLIELAATLEGLDAKSIDIGIDIDGKEDLAMVSTLVNNLDGETLNMSINLRGEQELIQAKIMAEALDGTDIDMDIDSGGHIKHAVSGFSRMQAIILGLLLLVPILSPVIASLGAATIGLAAGLTAAAGALGVVGLGLVPTVTGMFQLNQEIRDQQQALEDLEPGTEEFIETQKKIADLQAQMKEKYGVAAEGLDRLRESWANWTAETQGPAQAILGAAFTLGAQALTAFLPVFQAAAPVIEGALNSISAFIASGEGDEMIEFFTVFGTQALSDFLAIGGNLLRFFGNLFDAFTPFATGFLASIVEMTAGWADWAATLEESQGFQDFIDYVTEHGPEVWDLVENIIGAIINLGVALAPIGDIGLDAFNWLFEGMANMDPSVLGSFGVGLGIAAAAILGITAAIAVLNFVLALNPFILIAVAVIALIGVLIYLWNTNEGFRDAVIGAWNAIVAAVGVAVAWFQSNVLPVLQAVWDGIVTGWNAVYSAVAPIITLIVSIVQQGFSNLMAIVGPVMTFISGAVALGFAIIRSVVMTVLPPIVTFVRGAFDTVMIIVRTVMNVIGTIFRAGWTVVSTIIRGALALIQAILRTVLAAMQGNVTGVMAGIRSIFSTAWNTIRSVVSTVLGAIRSVVSSIMSGIWAVVRSIMNNVVNTFRSAWNSVRSAVSSGISAVRGMFAGAGGWLVGAGRSIIQGLINGIRGMIGAVRSAVSGVLSAARNLLPFSPAKEGPFSGRGWTLYSGRAIVEALARGVGDRKQMLVNQVHDVMGALQSEMQPGASEFGHSRVPQLAGVGAGRGDTNVTVVAHNPLPERSSTTAIREVSRLGHLGVFGG
jgi:hypothetical protein